MRVLFVAGREIGYARNEVLLRAFRRFAEVTVMAPVRQPQSLVTASARLVAEAAPAVQRGRYDLIFVGFYGYLITQALRRLSRAPLLFDAFVSNYDTLAFDRGEFAPQSARGRLALWLDRSTCALADHVLLDTEAHVKYFAYVLGVPRARLSALPVGCNEEIFRPSPPPAQGETTVLYYCTYLPLHGVDVVLHAASLLATQPVHFRLVGDGPLRPAMERLAGDLRLDKVTFERPLAAPQIAQAIAEAHICLGGHFGASGKAQRTVPGKVYQMLAAERPVIAANSAANRELLVDGESALLIAAGNPVALAEALLMLHVDAGRRAAIAAGGRAAFAAHASEAAITARLREEVERLTVTQQP